MSESSQRPPSFLGTGWSFPPEFVVASDTGAGQVRMTSDEEDIKESLSILLSTGEGERFLQPKYGLDLRDQLFEAMGTTARTYLLDRVRDGILVYEPRIEILDLDLDSSRKFEGILVLRLDYTVRTTNSRYNLVFPYYSAADGNELRTRNAALVTSAA
jgi:phage baseplate assembly protein W